jgi:hypothetical protein
LVLFLRLALLMDLMQLNNTLPHALRADTGLWRRDHGVDFVIAFAAERTGGHDDCFRSSCRIDVCAAQAASFASGFGASDAGGGFGTARLEPAAADVIGARQEFISKARRESATARNNTSSAS